MLHQDVMMDEDAHPHALESSAIPARLPAAELRALSRLSSGRALFAIGTEWAGIAGAIALASWVGHPLLTVLAVLFIGARQHALLVIAHDASHFRLLPSRAWNDWVGNLLLAWPMFISVQGFRHFHGSHHRFLGAEGDGNRILWGTHDAEGQLVSEWQYPKTRAGLAWTLLRRASGFTGLYWILRGLVGGFQFGVSHWGKAARVLFAAGVAGLLTWTGAWWGALLFWVLPYCTWHVAIQYVRLICEHSNIEAEAPGYALTRTTRPRLWESVFILPRGIGYHIEHHWYPSVPFYRLPELHARLLQEPGFAAGAPISRSVVASVRSVLAA
jgi:fatty acid desaturase